MKNLKWIYPTVVSIALFTLVGVAGGLELDRMTMKEALLTALVSLLAMVGAWMFECFRKAQIRKKRRQEYRRKQVLRIYDERRNA